MIDPKLKAIREAELAAGKIYVSVSVPDAPVEVKITKKKRGTRPSEYIANMVTDE